MLITQNLEIWKSSVSSDTYKQPAYALALCCSGKSHTERRTAKRRRQKPGIHIAFQELSLSPTWMGRVSLQQRGMLLLLQMAQAHCLTLSCKGKQRGIHLVMFWSASCMYWHMFLYITHGTSCHNISSLNLFWSFSHSIKLFLFIWNSKVHDLGEKKKKSVTSQKSWFNFWFYFPSW